MSQTQRVLVSELPTAAEVDLAFRTMTQERLKLRRFGIYVDDDGRILPTAKAGGHT